MSLLSLSISSPLTTDKSLINRVGPMVWNNNTNNNHNNNNNNNNHNNNNNNNFSYAIPYNLFKSKQSIILDEVFAEILSLLLRSLIKRVFEQSRSTRSEASPLTPWAMLSVFTLIVTICLKIWAKPLFKNKKLQLRLTYIIEKNVFV